MKSQPSSSESRKNYMTKNDLKMTLTNPRKRTTIRISINYCCVPGKCEPSFVGLADLQNPPHKWHGFRSITHNPEVSGSNPLPATKMALLVPFFV